MQTFKASKMEATNISHTQEQSCVGLDRVCVNAGAAITME